MNTLEDLAKAIEEDLKDEILPAEIMTPEEIESLLPPAELPDEGFESLEDLIEQELSDE